MTQNLLEALLREILRTLEDSTIDFKSGELRVPLDKYYAWEKRASRLTGDTQ